MFHRTLPRRWSEVAFPSYLMNGAHLHGFRNAYLTDGYKTIMPNYLYLTTLPRHLPTYVLAKHHPGTVGLYYVI